VGKEVKEFVYEQAFPDKTAEEKSFVEDLWARRKVGYLLDQIRANGEKKELVDEVVTLAKRYGITTPYTSYLVVPDAPVPVASGNGKKAKGGHGGEVPPGLFGGGPAGTPVKVSDFAKQVQSKPGDLEANRGRLEEEKFSKLPDPGKDDKDGEAKALNEAKGQKKAFDQARELLKRRQLEDVQAGQLGVDLSVQTNNLRSQTRLTQTALRKVNNRNCLEIGGVWIDEGYDAKMKTVTVKAMSAAYFRLLERQPGLRDVFRLGNHLLWVTPSGTALIVDTSTGVETMTNEEIDRLFTVPKQK
jgi:Ca-activated chloride channel family protein